jgi:hypothetical protein
MKNLLHSLVNFFLRLTGRHRPSLDGPLKGRWVKRVVYHHHRAPE